MNVFILYKHILKGKTGVYNIESRLTPPPAFLIFFPLDKLHKVALQNTIGFYPIEH